MEVIFTAFEIITPFCLAAWGYRRMGCIGSIILFVAAVWGLSSVEGYVHSAIKWRDKRLAEKAEQAEIRKAQDAENARMAEERRRQAEAVAEARRRQEAKDEKIRTFALKDAPKVWQVYQALQSEIDVQGGKIDDLRNTLKTFGKVPELDVDFNRICALRDEMIRSRQALRMKLEDAYIAAKKYEASPSRKDYQELHKKALEDGILEADQAEAKFKEMRLNK